MKLIRSEPDRMLQLGHAIGICGLLLCMLTACTSMTRDLEMPVISVNYVKPIPAEGLGLRFEIGLHIINPNDTALNIKGASYNVSLDGFQILNGVSNNMPSIAAYGEGDIKIEAQADLLDTLAFFNSMATEPRERFDYELNAKLNTSLFSLPIRIQDKGTIDLQP